MLKGFHACRDTGSRQTIATKTETERGSGTVHYSQNCCNKQTEWKRPQWQEYYAVTLLPGVTKELNTQRKRIIAQYMGEWIDKGRERIRNIVEGASRRVRGEREHSWEVWPSVWNGLYVCCEQPAQSVGHLAEEAGSLRPKCPGFPPVLLPRGLERTSIYLSTTVLSFVFMCRMFLETYGVRYDMWRGSFNIIQSTARLMNTAVSPLQCLRNVRSGSRSQEVTIIRFWKTRFIGNLYFLLFLDVNIQSTKHAHQDAHLATNLNYSCSLLCLEYNLIAKDLRKNLHEQAPVHKSWRLMSELMANANGHLQVANVIHGCQLTSHPE